MSKITKVSDLKIYQLAEQLGDVVWLIVGEWDYFAKDTIGKNLVRAVDSVALNLAEGFGRFGYKDVLRFSYIARGSLEETKAALRIAIRRDLISKERLDEVAKLVNALGPQLNGYIREQRNRVVVPNNDQIEEPVIEYSENEALQFP